MRKKLYFVLALLAYCAIGAIVKYDLSTIQALALSGCLVGAMAGKASRA